MRPVFSYDSSRQAYRLQTRVWLPRPRQEVFEFFADAFNLEKLTPPFLHFHVLTPAPIDMRAGRLIDYSLRLHGIPLRWQTEISVWEPPFRFVDQQLKGPYRLWHHEHQFHEQDGGTLCLDDIHYRVPLGFLVHGVFVKPDLAKIFDFRHQQMLALFGGTTQRSAA